MVAVFPVFGLIVLTVEWMIFRRVAPRLVGRSVGIRAVIGAVAGLVLSIAVAALGYALAAVTVAVDPPANVRDVLGGAASALFVTGIIFAPIAAIFGAVLLAVERYRTDELPVSEDPAARRPPPDDRR